MASVHAGNWHVVVPAMLVGSLATGLLAPTGASAQSPEFSAPRFLASRGDGSRPTLARIESVPALTRRITLDARTTRRDMLDRISRLARLRIVFSQDFVVLSDTIQIRASNLSVAAVLTETLLGTGADVLVPNAGSIVLVRRTTDAQAPELRVAGVVSGRVTEEVTGAPIPTALVMDLAARLSVATDDSGRFSLTGVPSGDREVRVRRLGYAPLARTVRVTDGETTVADFRLTRAVETLSEIVTTVTGGQERFKVGNAIATISPDSAMRRAPVTSLTELLQGRAAGLQVYFSGGLSGVSSTIRIRGTNGFTVSNDPIVIVDGARIESTGGPVTGLAGARPGRLSDLSPYEIETIDVLKGPSASTLYGSDAANGVIVIRTKRGAAGTQWRLWGEHGTASPAEHFAPFFYPYGTNAQTGAQQRCPLALLSAGTCRQDSLVTWNPLEDDVTSPLSTGRREVYGAQVGGGVQTFRYFLSSELTKETGYLRMPDAEQDRLEEARGVASLPGYQIRPNTVRLANLRANVGSAIGDRAHVQLSNSLTFNRSAIPSMAIFTGGALTGGSAPTTNGGWFLNRPGEQFSLKNVDNTTRLTSSVGGDYQPWSWLSTRGTIGLDLSNTIFEALQMNGQGPPATSAGSRRDDRYNIRLGSVDLGATGTYALTPKLGTRTSVGVQYNRRTEFNALTVGTTLAPGSTTLAGAATTSASESTIETIVAGMYVEEAVSFGDALFVTGAVRFDGGSAFGASFETAAYPRASVSWVATDGTKRGWPAWVDNLRLRVALGSAGVQPSAVAARQRDCLASTFVNGVNVSGATLCQVGNARLRPETQRELEGGVDAEFLGSRVRAELTLYDRKSSDAISNIALAPSVGQGLTRPENLGSVRNHGVEVGLDVRALSLPQATLDLGVRGHVNRNKLVSLGEGVTFSPTARNQPGYPVFSQFGFTHTFDDVNGDGIITATEVTIGTTPTWFGALSPQRALTGTAGLGLFRETLRFSAMGDYRGDFIIQNLTDVNNCLLATCRGLVDKNASLAEQAAAVAVTKNSSAIAGHVYDGRFLRIREVSVSYTVPTRAAALMRARGATLSVSGRNVGLFLSKYPGASVESSQSLPPGDGGIGAPAAPMARQWLLRLTLDY
jgi:TonB-dependent SusC/RagA subfamily outer membrane receptor